MEGSIHLSRGPVLGMAALALFLVLAVSAGLAGPAFGAVWTDKVDYEPGSVVTVSGDNRDGDGYLPGETVHVDVTGPNGYQSSCEGVANGSGAWSCAVIIWADQRAVGTYYYTATGLTSGVSQSGSFSDGNVKAKAAAAGVTFTLTKTSYSSSTNCTGAGTTTVVTSVDSSGNTTGVGNTESVKLQAAATSDQGGRLSIGQAQTRSPTLARERSVCRASPGAAPATTLPTMPPATPLRPYLPPMLPWPSMRGRRPRTPARIPIQTPVTMLPFPRPWGP